MHAIKFKRLHPDAKMPSKGTPHAACYDVVAVSRTITSGYIEYGLGFATEIPEGWHALVFPRSSISNYDLLLCNGVPVIDADFRGEWKLRFKLVAMVAEGGPADSRHPLPYNSWPPRVYGIGDKVAQVQFLPLPAYELIDVGALTDTERGPGGFGSTGQ